MLGENTHYKSVSKVKSEISEMQKYAVKHEVPIISSDGLDLLLALIDLKKPKRILAPSTPTL